MKKVLNVIKKILVFLLAVVAVGMLIFTVFSVNTFDQNNRAFLGYKIYVVRSDSMAATDFQAGDIILVKETDPTTLVPGDIISYVSQDTNSYGETVTHKIRSLTTTTSGEPGFITYGTTTGVDDELIVTYPYVLGKYSNRIPKVGTFFVFLKTIPGYVCCILIPFLLLIAYQGFNCIRLFRQYKSEQMDALDVERKKLEEERIQTAAMMAELRAMQAQLAREGGSVPDAPGAPAPQEPAMKE